MNLNLPKNIPRPEVPAVIKESRQSVITLIIIIAIGWLFYNFIISPKRTELNGRKAVLEKIQKESDSLSENVNSLQMLIDELNSRKKEVAMLDEALPLEAQVPRLHILLETTAKFSGMTIGNVSADANSSEVVAGNKALIEKPYEIERSVQKIVGSASLSGTFEQFQDFLQKLENNARLINITSLEIASSKDDSLDFKLNFEAYYYE